MKLPLRFARLPWIALPLAALLLAPPMVWAQTDHVVVEDDYETDVISEDYVPLSDAEIEELIGPIALYPDDLVSIVLPAATYPVQVVQAARFLEQREGNPDMAPPEDWDDAVVALLNYPEVIELMNDDLDWTWALGEAFLNQQAEVLAAIRDFRDEAYAAGNLRSDEHQVVRRSEEVIVIEPADPEVIYVPYYEPARVIVYHPYPVYHYHPWPRYSYYYPYPADYGFSYGYFFGVSTAFRLHWAHHSLYTYHYGYRGHPYFGRGYHRRFYYRHYPYRHLQPRHARSRGGYAGSHRRGDRWRPRGRHGPRPHAGARHQGGRFATDRPRRGHPAGADRPGRRDADHGGRRGDHQRQRPAAPGNRGGLGESGTRRGRGDSRSHDRPRHVYSDKDPEQKRLVRRYREEAAEANRPDNRRRATTRRNHDSRVSANAQSRPRARVTDESRSRTRPRVHADDKRQTQRRTDPRARPRATVPGERVARRGHTVRPQVNSNSARHAPTRRAEPPTRARPAQPRAAVQRHAARPAPPVRSRPPNPAQQRAAPARREAKPARRDERARDGGGKGRSRRAERPRR